MQHVVVIDEFGITVIPAAAAPRAQSSRQTFKPAAASSSGATPSFFCRLVDDVVYWNTSRFSG